MTDDEPRAWDESASDGIELDGEQFVFRSGPVARVEVTDGAGARLGSVMIPTDGRLDTTEDGLKRLAAEHYHDVRALAERFTPAQVDATVADLEAGDMFRAMVDLAAERVREGLTLTLSDDPDAPDDPTFAGISETERDRVAERATVLLHDRVGSILVTSFLVGDGAISFKTRFARDLMTEAWAWAVQDARIAATELEARAGDEKLSPDAFETLVNQIFDEGTYLTRSLLTRIEQTVQAIVEQFAHSVEMMPDLGRQLVAAAWLKIQDEDGGQRKAAVLMKPPSVPGFQDGRGVVPNDPITRAVTVAFQDSADGAKRWFPSLDGRPYFPFAGVGGWAATLFLSPEQYPTADAAWAAVRELDDDTADTMYVALAHWLANHRKNPEGLTYLTVHDILAQRGYAQHPHRGYEHQQKLAASQQMLALGSLEVEGRNFERYERTASGKRRKIRIAPKGRFLVISTREEQVAPDRPGTSMTTGFYYRVGDWAVSFQGDAGAPMLATMMQAVLSLHSYKDRHAKRLGRYLTWQFRLRAHTRTWEQPYPMGHLLTEAGLALPSNNPKRFRERIEAGLDELKARGIIGDWSYCRQGALPQRNWLPAWLAWRVVITPPQELIARYHGIGRRGVGAGRTRRQNMPACG